MSSSIDGQQKCRLRKAKVHFKTGWHVIFDEWAWRTDRVRDKQVTRWAISWIGLRTLGWFNFLFNWQGRRNDWFRGCGDIILLPMHARASIPNVQGVPLTHKLLFWIRLNEDGGRGKKVLELEKCCFSSWCPLELQGDWGKCCSLLMNLL